MAVVKGFKATIYNPQVVGDISKVICPPYDVICLDSQQRLLRNSPYNLIRLELSEDIPGQDKYTQAALIMRSWLKDKILISDQNPAIYVYKQQYTLKGSKRVRVGFLALLGLDDSSKNSVFGHEHTHIAPKEDRLRLLRSVRANLSPIFVIFPDKKKVIAQTLLPLVNKQQPFICAVDDEQVLHQVWRIDIPEVLQKVEQKMLKENIFIADGHHRYEVACAFRDEMKKSQGNINGNEGFNYILAYFTNIDSQGLTVLPIHRLVTLEQRPNLDELLSKLSEHFSVEEIKDQNRFFFLLAKAGVSEHVIGMHTNGRFWLLRLRNIKVLNSFMPDRIAEYRSLDVSILNALVLERLFKLNLTDKEHIIFSAQTDELLQEIKKNPTKIAFFLNPTKIEQIISIASKQEKMPPKSTYFYPKVASGLVIHLLD
ncbi:MAG: DUF1015 domain-containing protein [Candidatus Omnitrophica bacterium]|nr:DUF1015 domain-containing protein [Candidatus Omnitrophota bacterium]